MSQSKKRKPEDDLDGGEGNFPSFPRKFDRFCTMCAAVFENLALDKYQGIKCKSCSHVFDVGQQSDGNFRKCVRCCAYVKCKLKILNFSTDYILLKLD